MRTLFHIIHIFNVRVSKFNKVF